MIKSKSLKLVDEPDSNPNKLLADAIIEAGKRSEITTKSLIETIKNSIVQKAEIIPYEIRVPSEPQRARKWSFTIERDAQGLITEVTATSEPST